MGSGFNTPYGTAVDKAGNVFVADYSNQAVYEILASNGVVSSASPVVALAAPSGGYSEPIGVAVDKLGDVFVADAGTANAVDEIVAVNGTVNGSSTVKKLTGLPVFGFPNDLVVDVDGNGDLFIAYPDNAVVLEIVASGGVISSSSPIVALPAPSGGWAAPSGVAVDGRGDVFVADSGKSAIFEIPAAGGYTTINTIDASTGGAETITADANGNVFFIGDFDTVLYEIPAAGNYSAANILAVGFTGNYLGLAVDGHGNIFIGDAATSHVYELPLDRTDFGSQAIGAPGATISMPFNISLSGPTTVGKISVLTTGIAGKDFADAGSSTCVAGTYSNSTNCVVNVRFTPQSPGLRRGALVFFDGAGKVLGSVPLSGIGTGPQMTFQPGTQSTLAGGNFTSPTGVAVDASGNVFVADSAKNAVYEISATGGYTSVTALGSGFSQPSGVAIDGSGNLFVADTGNKAVKEITAAGGYTTVTTLGSGFSQPEGIALDGSGNVFVADAGNNTVFEILAAGGYTSINKLGSGFNQPNGVAVDGNGNVFVADSGNSAVKEILSVGNYATINTLGSGFARPVGLALDASGSVYVADASGNTLYEIPAVNGYATVNPIGGGFKTPSGVALDAYGNVFVADRGNLAVKKLDFADLLPLSFATTNVGQLSSDSPKTVEIQNIGNQALAFSGLSYPTDFPQSASDPIACSGSEVLNPAGQCDLPVDFLPLTAGNLSEKVTLTDNTLNASAATQTIPVSGTGIKQLAQTITFPAIAGQIQGATLTLAASASSHLAVSYTSLTPAVCSVSASTATLAHAGTCTIQASQAGNATYSAATPVSQSFTVTAAFTIIPLPPLETIYRGNIAIFLLELNAANGFNGKVTLSCSGGPANSFCANFPMTVSFYQGIGLAISGIYFPPTTPPGSYTLNITGVSGTISNTATATFTVVANQ